MNHTLLFLVRRIHYLLTYSKTIVRDIVSEGGSIAEEEDSMNPMTDMAYMKVKERVIVFVEEDKEVDKRARSKPLPAKINKVKKQMLKNWNQTALYGTLNPHAFFVNSTQGM